MVFENMLNMQLMMFLFIGVGFFIRKKGIVGTEGRMNMIDMCLYVTLPFNVFHSFLRGWDWELFIACGMILLLSVGFNLISIFFSVVLYKKAEEPDSAVIVDLSRKSVEVIRQNLEHTGFSKNAVVVQSDALSFLSRRTEKYDIALIDPPYSKGLVEAALSKVHEVMNEGGVIICEAPYKDELPEVAGTFRLQKKYRYGKTGLFLYRFAQEEA